MEMETEKKQETETETETQEEKKTDGKIGILELTVLTSLPKEVRQRTGNTRTSHMKWKRAPTIGRDEQAKKRVKLIFS
jgi:hypothetical protein